MRSARALLAAAQCTVALASVVAACASAATGDAVQPEAPPADTSNPWTLTPLYSHSGLSGDRPDRDTFDMQMLRRVTPQLILGALVDAQRRPPDTDVALGGSFSWYPLRTLEWRGAATAVPSASFLPRQTYTTGAEWRAGTLVSIALDYKRENFADGPINEWTPALTLWFSDETWLTARYTRGRAFGEEDFNAYAILLNLGMPASGRLTLAYAHGADPEKDPGVPGVILTNATTYAAYYRFPLRRGFDLIVGAEYEDRPGIYTKTTGSVGFNASF
jgi:YaiO family outer membrane protein